MSGARGWTLAEILVALVLGAIVATAITELLVSHLRLNHAQGQAVALDESVRTAAALLPAELRELSAGDGDIIAMDATSLTYRSMQGLAFLCADPAGTDIMLDRSLVFGLRPAIAVADSVFLFAEGDPLDPADDGWRGAGVAATTVGTGCPGSRPSLGATLAGVTVEQLQGVRRGSPVRMFRPTVLRLYQDGGGQWWLGVREFSPSSGSWASTQPVLGPVSGTGLTLSYLDSAGIAIVDPAGVTSVAISVQGRSAVPVRRAGAVGVTFLVRDLVTQVSLRNNPWY